MLGELLTAEIRQWLLTFYHPWGGSKCSEPQWKVAHAPLWL